jgi:hypothetical protein
MESILLNFLAVLMVVLLWHPRTGESQPPNPAKEDLTVSYRVSGSGADRVIQYYLPYLDKIDRGETVSGYFDGLVTAPFPGLSGLVTNNLGRTVLLTQAIFSVRQSQAEDRPIIVVYEDKYEVDKVILVNQGWADTQSGRLTILGWGKLTPDSDTHVHCADKVFPYGSPTIFSVGGINDRGATINIRSSLPAELQHDYAACILGTFEYTWDAGRSGVVNFHSAVSLTPPGPGAPPGITATYDLHLPCGKSGYQLLLPIAQTIKDGDADHFMFRTWSERTCSFVMDVSFETTERMQIPAGRVAISIFVPRSGGGGGVLASDADDARRAGLTVEPSGNLFREVPGKREAKRGMGAELDKLP